VTLTFRRLLTYLLTCLLIRAQNAQRRQRQTNTEKLNAIYNWPTSPVYLSLSIAEHLLWISHWGDTCIVTMMSSMTVILVSYHTARLSMRRQTEQVHLASDNEMTDTMKRRFCRATAALRRGCIAANAVSRQLDVCHVRVLCRNS